MVGKPLLVKHTTMDVKQLDKALIELVEKKIILSNLDYNDERYDEVEEELHDMEDNFVESYGDYLEDALHAVHDEFCPDNDVLLPIAYLANHYIKKEVNGETTYTTLTNQGVPVDVDDFPGKRTRIVLLPAPARLVLIIDNTNQQVVWKAE